MVLERGLTLQMSFNKDRFEGVAYEGIDDIV